MQFSLRHSFFYLACLGWMASFVLHIISLFGINPGPGIWVVGVAIIPVWVVFVRRLKRENPQTTSPTGWTKS